MQRCLYVLIAVGMRARTFKYLDPQVYAVRQGTRDRFVLFASEKNVFQWKEGSSLDTHVVFHYRVHAGKRNLVLLSSPVYSYSSFKSPLGHG